MTDQAKSHGHSESGTRHSNQATLKWQRSRVARSSKLLSQTGGDYSIPRSSRTQCRSLSKKRDGCCTYEPRCLKNALTAWRRRPPSGNPACLPSLHIKGYQSRRHKRSDMDFSELELKRTAMNIFRQQGVLLMQMITNVCQSLTLNSWLPALALLSCQRVSRLAATRLQTSCQIRKVPRLYMVSLLGQHLEFLFVVSRS